MSNRNEVELIKSKLDIVDVISDTVHLDDRGGGVWTGAISPSSQSGRSLNVDRNMQLWHDWASGGGGDVFDWIAYKNNLDRRADFRQVLEITAEMTGVQLSHEQGDSEQYTEIDQLHTIFTAVAEYYHSNLTVEGRQYITQQWGISNETIDKLKIGFAPRGGPSLTDVFEDIFHEEDLIKTGLLDARGDGDDERWINLFKGRIIFPYWKNGKVVYFIGRQTPETPQNKYEHKYSKQRVYKKGRAYISVHVRNDYFYGEDSIRGTNHCLITEGITDSIMAHQAGIPCISPVTTNFKKSEMEKMLSMVKDMDLVYICNDNEASEAGTSGALKTAEFLVENKVKVKLIELPLPDGSEKIDLAEYLRDHMTEEFRQLMTDSKDLFTFKLHRVERTEDTLNNVEIATDFIKSELRSLDPLHREAFIDSRIKAHFNFNDSIVLKLIAISAFTGDIDNVDLPHPYFFEDNEGELGLYKRRVSTKSDEVIEDYIPLCYDPTWIDMKFINPVTEKHYVNLNFKCNGHVTNKIVSQRDVLTSIGIRSLTEYGLNVPDGNAKYLAEYYGNFIRKSSSISTKDIYSKFGWVSDTAEFIIGDEKISVSSIEKAYVTDDIISDTVDGHKRKGTIEGWVEYAKDLLIYKNARFLCYGAIAALLLRKLNANSFIIELGGRTSIGKTTCAQLAMSCIGNPENLMMSTNATKVFVERICATCTDLPIHLDETSLIPTEVLKEITYMVSGGTGKGRGKKEGGIHELDKWKSVCITTGESPLTSYTSLGGQEVRIVSVPDGLGAKDEASVDKFKDHCTENYGHIARLAVQKILNEEQILEPQFTKVRNTFKEKFSDKSSGIYKRLINTYSVIVIGGIVFEAIMDDLGLPTQNPAVLVESVLEHKMEVVDESLSERAFNVIIDWVNENERNFCIDQKPAVGGQYLLWGNIGYKYENDLPVDYVDILPNVLRETLDKKLDRKGISSEILKQWKEEGKIDTFQKGYTRPETIKEGMSRQHIIRLIRPNFEEVTHEHL